MPEPVTTGELLLQRIADRLDSIDAMLRQERPRQATKKTVAAKKTPSTPNRVDVDGD